MSGLTRTSVVLGLEINRLTLFENVGQVWGCANAHYSHGEGPVQKYCGQCGSQIRERPVERATDKFGAWAAKQRMRPEEAWDALVNAADTSERTGKCAIHSITTMQPVEHGEERLAFGILLMTFNPNHDPGSDVIGADQVALEEWAGLILRQADEMGIKPGILRLFLTLYMS